MGFRKTCTILGIIILASFLFIYLNGGTDSSPRESLIETFLNIVRFCMDSTQAFKDLIGIENNRTIFIQRVVAKIESQTEGLCNCIVFSLNKRHEQRLNEVKYFKVVKFGKERFGVWVAEAGSFRNDEWFKQSHWGFIGDYVISGITWNQLTFNQRSCPIKFTKEMDKEIADLSVGVDGGVNMDLDPELDILKRFKKRKNSEL